MRESKEHKIPSDQQATWPLIDRFPNTKVSVQSGEDLMSRLGDSIKDKNPVDSGVFETIAYFSAGDIIADKYRIIQLLSRGSMGMVYQAKHLLLDKIVAIKVLAPEKPLEEVSRQRFLREAHA